jgi:hypothetical protein
MSYDEEPDYEGEMRAEFKKRDATIAALRAELAAVAEAMHGPTMQPLAERVRSYVEAAEKRGGTISTLVEWANTYGAELKPPGADTFGEGMREAKARVRRILTAEGGGG